MRLSEGDVVCGVPAAAARATVRAVDDAQWCSADALARRLGMDAAACRSLIQALEDDGYPNMPYRGRLPEPHRGEWLPAEDSDDEPPLLWHLSYPKGKSLAKARIGPPVPRAAAEGLVRDVLARVNAVNRDPASTHVITRVALFGSMTDPSRELVSDVDLAVWADRRAWQQQLTEREGRRVTEDRAARDRSGLEAVLASGDERIDVSVVDGWSETTSAVPPGATEVEVYPDLSPAAGWADATPGR